ncbi:MAG: NAD(P)/FAD-dependent oxidoreductase, partial [Sphingomonas adhaesiva]
YLAGRYALPDVEEMRRITARDEEVELGDYYQSARHTIQVDFGRYVADLHKEIAAGEKRASAGQKVAA